MSARSLVRPMAGVLIIAFATVASVPAHAQGVLGRIRDRARQAVSPGPAAPQRCDQSLAINGDFVTRYILALQAREAELRRLAQESSRNGRYFTAMLRQDSSERRRNDFDAQTGPDWARQQALTARMQRGDQAAVQEMQALHVSISQRVDLPSDADFGSVTAATQRMDTVMAQAGGFSVCEWRAVVDVVPGGVAQIARDPSAPIAAVGGGTLRDDAVNAIKAHRIELVRLLKLSYRSDEMIAREQRERAHQDSMTNAVTAWQACRERVMGPAASPAMGVSQDSMRVWQQQIEDAQKRGDQSTLMAIGQKMAMAMAPGMNQRAMASAQAQQQCGPPPGTPR